MTYEKLLCMNLYHLKWLFVSVFGKIQHWDSVGLVRKLQIIQAKTRATFEMKTNGKNTKALHLKSWNFDTVYAADCVNQIMSFVNNHNIPL